MIARIIAWALKLNLSPKKRLILVNAVIHTLGVPPLKAIITTDDSRRIVIQGKPLSIEQSLQLQESAIALRNNQLLRLIRDQVRFKAIDMGYLKNLQSDPYQEMFYKAVLWLAQEEDELIEALGGNPET